MVSCQTGCADLVWSQANSWIILHRPTIQRTVLLRAGLSCGSGRRSGPEPASRFTPGSRALSRSLSLTLFPLLLMDSVFIKNAMQIIKTLLLVLVTFVSGYSQHYL